MQALSAPTNRKHWHLSKSGRTSRLSNFMPYYTDGDEHYSQVLKPDRKGVKETDWGINNPAF